jgi:hypothetical protein
MKALAPMKKLAWIFGATGVLLMVVVWDWLPTAKDLNRLRREQRDAALKTKNSTRVASGFIFPDADEKLLFAKNNLLLRRSLPHLHDHDAWLALVTSELQAQARAKGIANVRIYSDEQAMGAEFDKSATGRPDRLADWLLLHSRDIRESYQNADDPGRYPWHGVFSGTEFVRNRQLASRPLLVALAAPLPALLGFINRISWEGARLEVVRLHLEPGAVLSRAWLICRGSYLASQSSVWVVEKDSATAGENLLVDPDSPLLWQKVNPDLVPPILKKELPTAAGRDGE